MSAAAVGEGVVGDDVAVGLDDGREEGIEEGRDEGIEEGRREGRRVGFLDGISVGAFELSELLTKV